MVSGSPQTAPSKPRLSRRTVYILSSVATVVVLAGVIFGISALSDPAESDRTVLQLSAQDEGDRLFESALAALDAGDQDAAEELLRKALNMDPANARVREELARIVESKLPDTPADDGDPDDGDPDDSQEPVSDPNAGFTDPVDDLARLLPVSAKGYELGLVTVVGTDANVAGDPTDSGPIDVVTRALFSVHDFETTDKAAGFVTNVTKSAFPENGADVTVDGIPGYFGTDGVRFATVAFSRGRFAFEVIVTTDSGAPGALLDVAIEAARAFPDSL